jgi:probable HAF family extracellular repeat protein
MRLTRIGKLHPLLAALGVALAASVMAAEPPVAIDLGTLGGTNSSALAVNRHGQVVGVSSIAGEAETHAFSWTQSGGMIDLGTSGSPYAFPVAVNASGQVAGWSYTTGYAGSRAFSWTPSGGLIDLGSFGGTYTFAYAENDAGQIVGFTYTMNNAEARAFLWTKSGGMVDLGTLGGPLSQAFAISAGGQIVGSSFTTTYAEHAFSWTPSGGMIDLGTLGGGFSRAVAVNANGQVVGVSTIAGDAETHAFSWTPSGGMVDVGTLGGDQSLARGVDAHGQAVGDSNLVPGSIDTHAISWTPSAGLIDIGTLGGPTSRAMAVNAGGQVVGFADTDYGPGHAFLWTSSGGMVDLGLDNPRAYSYGLAVSDNGHIVGSGVPAGSSQFHALLWPTPTPPLFLHSDVGHSPVLFLDTTAPTNSTARYKDSPPVSISGGNPWKEVGTWTASPELTDGLLRGLGGVGTWIGLKNSDDQGTRFDLRIEVRKNASEVVAAGEVACIDGVTRNPAKAKEVVVTLLPFPPVSFDGSGDALSLRVLTRIGSGGSCVGHKSAVGLRLYFDAFDRDSRIETVQFDETAP